MNSATSRSQRNMELVTLKPATPSYDASPNWPLTLRAFKPRKPLQIIEILRREMNANGTHDDAKTCELEDQFILRLPPKQARVVRKILQKKPKKLKKHMSIQLDNDLRHGVVKVHRKFLHAKLFDLPTIIESNKTVDKVHFFKTADVCQILICQENQFADEEEEEAAEQKRVGKTYLSPHGYAPPLKNVRKFRFRKTLHNKEDAEETADIEKEVLWLLRMDNEAVSTKFEFIYDDKLNNSDVLVQADEVNELSLFGEKLSDLESDEESASDSVSSCEVNDIMDFTN